MPGRSAAVWAFWIEAHEDEEVEQQNAHGADEAVLFAEGGEDEVGVGDGEEVALGLGALVGALAPDAAGADGDQGLADLVAGAAGVGVGVDEGVDAGFCW